MSLGLSSSGVSALGSGRDRAFACRNRVPGVGPWQVASDPLCEKAGVPAGSRSRHARTQREVGRGRPRGQPSPGRVPSSASRLRRREPWLSAVPKPPARGASRWQPQGTGSQTAFTGSRRKAAEGEGRCHQSLQGRCDRRRDLSLLTLNLTTWLTGCPGSVSGSSTVKVSSSPFPTLRLGAGSPPRAAHAEGAENPSPGEVHCLHESAGIRHRGPSPPFTHSFSHPFMSERTNFTDDFDPYSRAAIPVRRSNA